MKKYSIILLSTFILVSTSPTLFASQVHAEKKSTNKSKPLLALPMPPTSHLYDAKFPALSESAKAAATTKGPSSSQAATVAAAVIGQIIKQETSAGPVQETMSPLALPSKATICPLPQPTHAAIQTDAVSVQEAKSENRPTSPVQTAATTTPINTPDVFGPQPRPASPMASASADAVPAPTLLSEALKNVDQTTLKPAQASEPAPASSSSEVKTEYVALTDEPVYEGDGYFGTSIGRNVIIDPVDKLVRKVNGLAPHQRYETRGASDKARFGRNIVNHTVDAITQKPVDQAVIASGILLTAAHKNDQLSIDDKNSRQAIRQLFKNRQLTVKEKAAQAYRAKQAKLRELQAQISNELKQEMAPFIEEHNNLNHLIKTTYQVAGELNLTGKETPQERRVKLEQRKAYGFSDDEEEYTKATHRPLIIGKAKMLAPHNLFVENRKRFLKLTKKQREHFAALAAQEVDQEVTNAVKAQKEKWHAKHVEVGYFDAQKPALTKGKEKHEDSRSLADVLKKPETKDVAQQTVSSAASASSAASSSSTTK